MAASSQRVLMGLGARSLELDWEPALAVALVKGALIQVYKGETLDDTWVITQREAREEGISIAGVAPDWLLGLESEGPLIEDHEYLAGNNKVFNPGFELGDLYYRLGEDTLWAIAETVALAGAWARSPRNGLFSAFLNLDPIDEYYLPETDDILEADRDYDVLPGEAYRLSAWVRRLLGSVGRLRLRALLGGTFAHPNLVPAFGPTEWDDFSEFPGDTVVADGSITIGPCTRRQLVGNYQFDQGVDGLDGWTVTEGTWAVDGLLASPEGPTARSGLAQSLNVFRGETWRIEADIEPFSPTDGEAFIQIDQLDESTPIVFDYTSKIPGNGDTYGVFGHVQEDIEIRDATDTIAIFLVVQDVTVTQDVTFGFTRVLVSRVKGNRATTEMVFSYPILPGRTYEGGCSMTPGTAFVSGAVEVFAVFSADGRDTITQQLTSVELKPGEAQFPSITVKPPSGYDEFFIRFVGLDIVGDAVTVASLQIKDSDPNTSVFEVKSAESEADYTELTFDMDVPAGAEKFRLQIVAESQSAGWEVDDLDAHRIGATSTVAQIAEALLSDFDTGNPQLLPGDINGDDVITYDWHIINQHNRDALKHLLEGGVAASLREYRVNTDLTVDVGTAAEVFEDRTDLVFTESDIDVLVSPSIAEDATNRATHIKVIGATRRRANGDSFTITATAEVPWADSMLDAFGEPLHRVRLVENSTINHPDYAAKAAAFLADQEAARPKACTLRLSSDRARGAGIREGQWIYVYSPDAGLVDEANEHLAQDGSVIFPERIRVLSVTETYGEGDCSAVLVRPGQDDLELGTSGDGQSGVRWADKTEITVQLGAYVPDFVVNGQEDPGKQFMRYRAQALR